MSWKTVKIEEIASVKGGKRLPVGHDFLNEQTPHLYIRARDIGGNKISIINPVYISDSTFNKIKNYTVIANDLVITIVGANIGDVGFITQSYDGANLTENAARIRVDKRICEPRFLSFQMSNQHVKEKFRLLASGAAQGKLGLYKINMVDVALPPMAVQQKIASILSAYDDLIENNRRRIQLLEESARQLYKEWFVRLRFPGHEHVKVVDGVPGGWERKALGEVAPFHYGKALTAENRHGGNVPVYASSGQVGAHDKALVKAPGIVVGRKGNVGSVYWVNKDYYPIDTTYYITSERADLFFYYAISNLSFISTDVAVPGLNRDYAHSRTILLPVKIVLSKFLESTTVLHKQIDNLNTLNDKLAQARDLLLPKLMSGEVAV